MGMLAGFKEDLVATQLDAPPARASMELPDDRASIVSISGLNKTFASGLRALKDIELDIRKGEIFALLGPNGAGKTTLIGIICGTVNPSAGTVRVAGYDVVDRYRITRSMVGLVPQELHTGIFETVWDAVRFSRGLFGLAPNKPYLERLLRDLSLWNKRDAEIQTLSGGMKRRVLIAKALAHEPSVLFLDEPTAGVDVELRQDMWNIVRGLRDTGVTVILTTHYIEEAEEMADRVGVIHQGDLILVQDKHALMRQLGKKQMTLHLQAPLAAVPEALSRWDLALKNEGHELELTFGAGEEQECISALLRRIGDLGIEFSDLNTRQSSLEEIFVDIVRARR